MTLPVLPCSAVVLGLVINSPSSVAAFCLLSGSSGSCFSNPSVPATFSKTKRKTNNNQMTQNISSLQMFCDFRCFFPTCQVRVVRFYVSLLFSFSSSSSPPSSSSSINWDPLSSVWRAGPQWQLGSSEFSVACWTSTAIL